jgi:hypothetical protein
MTSYELRLSTTKLRSKETLKSLRPTHYVNPLPSGLDPLVVFIFQEIRSRGLSEQRVGVAAGLAMDTLRYWRHERKKDGKTISVALPTVPNVRAVLNVLGYELVTQPIPAKSKRLNLITKSTCLIPKSVA